MSAIIRNNRIIKMTIVLTFLFLCEKFMKIPKFEVIDNIKNKKK